MTLVRCQNRTKEESPRKSAHKMKAVVNSKLYYGVGKDSGGMQCICEWTALLIVRPTMEPPVLPISTTACLKPDDFLLTGS